MKSEEIIDYDVLKIFPTPIIKIKFDKHDNYKFEDIEKTVNLPQGWYTPLNTSFPNIQDDDKFIDARTRDNLKQDLKNSIDKVFFDLKLPTNYSLYEFWYNIYHDNQGQEQHNHMTNVSKKPNYWSGIYYNKNTTPTIFARSDKMYQTNQFPDHDKSMLCDCYYQMFYPHVNDGDILIFPPHLDHYVPLSKSDNMRLTFSFNLCLN